MRGQPTPRQVAQIDQDNAAIDDLTRQIRRHWDNCLMAGECPGGDILARLADLGQAQRNGLLVAALVRLAQTPGNPAGPTTIEEGPR